MGNHLPAVVAILTVGLLVWTSVLVGNARRRHGIKAPATSGHPDFERVFRAQMNTLEAAVAFLPSLWLAAHYWNPAWAGALGLVWIVGRVWYVLGYVQEAGRRGGGFLLAGIVLIALLGAACWGVARAVLGW